MMIKAHCFKRVPPAVMVVMTPLMVMVSLIVTPTLSSEFNSLIVEKGLSR